MLVDEAHHNFHTASGRFAPFVRLLEGVGIGVVPSVTPFRRDSLDRGFLLVVANALHADNAGGEWSLPTPSAFTNSEIETVRQWVREGGALLLIADHMPFPGAAAELAAAFGVEFTNGFAFDADRMERPRTCLRPEEIHVFRRDEDTLTDHSITNGRDMRERVESVGTFTGQAFRVAEGATPLLLFGDGAVSLQPETAWEFPPGTARIDVEGWSQGVVLEAGAGRVGIFGEAAMFTEQTCGGGLPMGMNAPEAADNEQFVLNLVRWLAGDL